MNEKYQRQPAEKGFIFFAGSGATVAVPDARERYLMARKGCV